MLSYRTPGVYFEYADPPHLLPGPRTDVAGFVGIAQRGPLHEPVKLESWTQFLSVFGGVNVRSYLPYAVHGFFANGGRECWVVRAADPEAASSGTLSLLDEASGCTIELHAATPGSWSGGLAARLQRVNSELFNLTLRFETQQGEFWPRVSLDPQHQRFIGNVLAGLPLGFDPLRPPQPGDVLAESRFARAWVSESGVARLRVSEQTMNLMAAFTEGTDGLATLDIKHLSGEGAPPDARWGLAALEQVDEVSIVAVPDAMLFLLKPPSVDVKPQPGPNCDLISEEAWMAIPAPVSTTEIVPLRGVEAVVQLQQTMIAQCERLHDRVAVLDSIPGHSPVDVQHWREQFASDFGALYYPWVLTYTPSDAAGGRIQTRTVPPSGHVAGVYARLGLSPGVHKPPANELIEDVLDVERPINDGEHALLNEASVNVIRLFNGRRLRIAGARTLHDGFDGLSFVNVRRLLNMITEAIEEGTQWAVHESSNELLWIELERIVRQYLNGLWQRGMLSGASQDEAFTVICDATTNPPEVREAGRVICRISVRPPWPAEFVVVRIGVTNSGVEILEVNSDGRNRGA